MTIKIRVKVGDIEVDYEGSEGFLDKKLPLFISQLTKVTGSPSRSGGADPKGGEETGSLATFLQKHGGGNSQEQRFLLTAQWLHLRGSQTLKTGDVSKALRDNRQSRLANPSDSLNKNVRKGLCEKTPAGFFVTEEGKKAIG